MISGDPNIMLPGTPVYKRAQLQRAQVVALAVVYWGRGNLWPKIPKGHFDVVTVQDPFWRGLFAWFVAKYLGSKLNIQVHTDLSAQNFLRHVLTHIVLRHADSIRVVSQKIKEQVLRCSVHAPVHVLPIYIDIEPFRTVVPQAHEHKTILWVGRFETEKDPLQAIYVFEKVREAGIDARLVMLGEGSLQQKLLIRAKELPVEFPGWQNPRSYLSRADVVLSTSLHESWGASVIEALAAHVPVVAPDVGVAREAGAVVVPRKELAKAVVGVLRSGSRGELKLSLPGAEEWARRWRETLP